MRIEIGLTSNDILTVCEQAFSPYGYDEVFSIENNVTLNIPVFFLYDVKKNELAFNDQLDEATINCIMIKYFGVKKKYSKIKITNTNIWNKSIKEINN